MYQENVRARPMLCGNPNKWLWVIRAPLYHYFIESKAIETGRNPISMLLIDNRSCYWWLFWNFQLNRQWFSPEIAGLCLCQKSQIVAVVPKGCFFFLVCLSCKFTCNTLLYWYIFFNFEKVLWVIFCNIYKPYWCQPTKEINMNSCVRW